MLSFLNSAFRSPLKADVQASNKIRPQVEFASDFGGFMGFKSILPNEIVLSPFKVFDKEWALLSAGTAESFNSMTVSWGGVGTLWSRAVATVYVRPQRYTREFIEREDFFTLCFFNGSHMKDLSYIGNTSGKNKDKIAATDLTPCFNNSSNSPMFEQAELVLVCKKLYFDDIKKENISDSEIIDKNYPKSDFHRLYIGEVVEAFIKE
ncbi:MAG: flavin reductase family protein [Oscillospiraceae bacterium]